jgi:hypothetical protein
MVQDFSRCFAKRAEAQFEVRVPVARRAFRGGDADRHDNFRKCLSPLLSSVAQSADSVNI